MLEVDSTLRIDDTYLVFRYARSSGPGGQNVNKVETKVELRFQLDACPDLSPAHKERLRRTFPSYVTTGGEFILQSDRFRSRERNRDDVLERLAQMLSQTRRSPKRRIATKPSRAQKRRRLEDKRRRSEVKRQRRGSHED